MFLLLLAGLARGGELSLRDALDEAMQRNPELQVARLDLERSQLALAAARGAWDPLLDLAVDASTSEEPSNDNLKGVDVVRDSMLGWSAGMRQAIPWGGTVSLVWAESVFRTNALNAVTPAFTSTSARLRLSQPLLQGGGPVAARLGLRSAELDVLAQEARWQGDLEDLALTVCDAYWALVGAQEGRELAERSLAIATQQLADTRERKAEGFAGSGDVLQVERAHGVARQALVAAEARLEAASDRMARLVGREVGVEAIRATDTPQRPDTAADLDVILAGARQANATWRAAGIARERAHLSLRGARNDALPTVSVVGSVGLTGGADEAGPARRQITAAENRSWTVGASLGVPIPARQKRATLTRARIADDQAEIVLDAAEQDLVLAAREAVRNLRRDRELVRLSELTVRAASAALDADRELLNDGKGSSRDVVRSLESLEAAQVARLEAEIALQGSLLRLRRVEGTLLDTLGLTRDEGR